MTDVAHDDGGGRYVTILFHGSMPFERDDELFDLITDHALEIAPAGVDISVHGGPFTDLGLGD